MTNLFRAQHISVSIARSPAEIYRYASDPTHLPEWAAGLAGATIHREGDHWISESALGRVKIRFAAPNSLGVMDHDVTVPSGETTHNAFRVVPNAQGAEVIFTLLQAPGMNDEQFAADAAQIRKDLETLKGRLE